MTGIRIDKIKLFMVEGDAGSGKGRHPLLVPVFDKRFQKTEREREEQMEDKNKKAKMLKAMGDKRFDVEAYLASEDGKDHAELMGTCMQKGEGTLEDMEYWRACGKGMKKELHGDPADVHTKWASYLPLAAVREMEQSTGRKFPLIFNLHGAHNPILMTEAYGITQLAAREECIVIAPENENEEKILELLEYARTHYPLDESRVYCMGYSFGGFMTSRNAWRHPELFAGVGMGGMLFAGDVIEHTLDGQFYPAYHLTEEMVEHMKEVELPVLLFMGENEMLCLEPLWREPESEIQDGVIPLDGKDKKQAFQNWRRAAGCERKEFREKEYYEGHSDPVVKSIGAEFERTEVREQKGRKYFIGDSLKEDGECLFRTVSCEKMNHSVTSYFPELIWEHIGKYARDIKTGKLIRL